MIIVSLLLIVVAATLLLLGLWQPSSLLLNASIGTSLLAAVLLIVGARRPVGGRDEHALEWRPRHAEPSRRARRSGARDPRELLDLLEEPGAQDASHRHPATAGAGLPEDPPAPPRQDRPADPVAVPGAAGAEDARPGAATLTATRAAPSLLGLNEEFDEKHDERPAPDAIADPEADHHADPAAVPAPEPGPPASEASIPHQSGPLSGQPGASVSDQPDAAVDTDHTQVLGYPDLAVATDAGDDDYLPDDEPAVQQVSAADAERVGVMSTEVLVVDGRPRYHLAGCVHLLGRESEPLPVSEAVELGFSPCSLCEPDSALLADARRV